VRFNKLSVSYEFCDVMPQRKGIGSDSCVDKVWPLQWTNSRSPPCLIPGSGSCLASLTCDRALFRKLPPNLISNSSHLFMSLKLSKRGIESDGSGLRSENMEEILQDRHESWSRVSLRCFPTGSRMFSYSHVEYYTRQQQACWFS
jgi:hypothetical protein